MLNKQIIKDAIADAKEIEKFAIEQAKKSLEEALMPQIERAIQESLNESSENTVDEVIENDSVNESITSTPTETISENTTPKNIQEMEMHNEENLHEDELFEVEGLFEDEVPAEETAQEPIGEPTGEPTGEPAEASVEAKLDDLAAKIDQLLAVAQGGEGEDTSAEGEVEVVDDETAGTETPAPAPSAPAPAPAPASNNPSQTVTEDMSEEDDDLDEVMFEIEEEGLEEVDEEGITYEVSLEEDMEDDSEDLEDSLYEIDFEGEELEDEGIGLGFVNKNSMGRNGHDNLPFHAQGAEKEECWNEEGVEESRALAFTAKNRGSRYNEKNLPKHTPVTTPAKGLNESKIKSKIKAQYESKMDELIKENESLKGVIKNYKSNLKEFENSFVELKSQLNEMQVFNGKLAYANKLLTKGGLTNDEKIRIAEEFDKCPTVEDAKKLYNKIISENQFSTKETITDKLKSAKPSTVLTQNINESKSETLFESEERRRMRMLAGIVKPINE